VVFRAVDERVGRQMALKIVASALASDVAFRQRFIRESRSAAAVVRAIRSLIPARIDRLPWSQSQAVLGLPPRRRRPGRRVLRRSRRRQSLEGIATPVRHRQPAEAIFRANGPAESADEQ
jgi:hypothetical protein